MLWLPYKVHIVYYYPLSERKTIVYGLVTIQYKIIDVGHWGNHVHLRVQHLYRETLRETGTARYRNIDKLD